MRDVTGEAVAHLARAAGFEVAAGQAEKRAAQLARIVAQTEQIRQIDLGQTPPAAPWLIPADEGGAS